MKKIFYLFFYFVLSVTVLTVQACSCNSGSSGDESLEIIGENDMPIPDESLPDDTGSTDEETPGAGEPDAGVPSDPDNDSDGFTVSVDCNDNDAAVNPNIIEICNAQDDNCDGVTDEGFDVDADTFTSCSGDCDDNAANVYPGAVDVCNDDVDANCDPSDCQLAGSINLSDLGDEDRVKFIGESTGDFAGAPLALAGSVNGDEFLDILIGAYKRTSEAGPPHSGAAFLVLGGSLSGSVTLDADTNPNIIEFIGEEAFDRAGSVASAGNVNLDGDGNPDVLIGAWNAQHTDDGAIPFPAHNDDGYGAAYLVNSASILADADRKIDLSGADIKFLGLAQNDKAGKTLISLADFDGDGLDDVTIGSLFSDADLNGDGIAEADIGSVHLFGSDFLKDQALPALLNLDQAGLTFVGESENDWAGFSVASGGDINGDGLVDLLISAPQGGTNNQGVVYLLLRPEVIVDGTYSLANRDVAIFGENDEDTLGISAVQVGDVNGDGFDDVLIGAPEQDRSADALESGAAYLVFGGDNLPPVISLATDLNVPPTGVAIVKFLGKAAADLAGANVAHAGDVNNDGFDDFLIGASARDDNTKSGTAYLVYGGAQSLSGTIDLANEHPSVVEFHGEAADDEAGTSVAPAGDMNGDGFDDFLIGAWRHDAGRGAVYLIYGAGQ